MYTRFLLSAILLMWTVAPAAHGAQAGTVDTAGGYGWQVLEKILPAWQPPAEAAGPVILSVRLGSNGEVLYCDARKSSGNPAVDMAACSAVSAAANYPPPPNRLPVEIFLALPASGGMSAGSPQSAPSQAYQPAPGQPAGPGGSGPDLVPAPSGNYADTVMAQIRPHLSVPPDFKGEAVVVVHLRVNEKGSIVRPEIIEASGSTPRVNEAVMDAIAKAGTMPPPSSPSQILILTFTIRGL